MIVNQTVKHDPPERLARFRPFGTPPEPPAGSFVKGPEEDRDFTGVQLLQVAGNDVYITQHHLVFG